MAELLELVSANPLRTVGISVAALFRSIEAKKPTLLIDEAESLRGRGERVDALREILNAGYRKGQKVVRCSGGNGKDYEPREFETFCPKVLVLIGSLPDTLADRCIPAQMKRRTTENLGRFRFGRVNNEIQPLRATAKRWARQNRASVQSWYEKNDLFCLDDREEELWLPLFAVCAIAAPERLSELENIATQLSGVKAADEHADFGIKLLADIRAIFLETACDRLRTTDLCSKLNEIPESPWRGWSNGRGLDARSLSHLLRPFGIQPANLRIAQDVVKGYEKADFEDAWSRYLSIPPLLAATSATELKNQSDSTDSPCATEPLRSGCQNEKSANVYAGCSGAADETDSISNFDDFPGLDADDYPTLTG